MKQLLERKNRRILALAIMLLSLILGEYTFIICGVYNLNLRRIQFNYIERHYGGRVVQDNTWDSGELQFE